MKKLNVISVVILMVCFICIFLAFSLSASAAETEGDFTYEITNGEATITGFSTSYSGALKIPSTLGGYPVTSIGNYAFENCNRLTSIEIPSSVTSIGEWAFCDCTGLTSVTFAENSQLTSIGSYAFIRCSGLTSIEIPSSITSIESRAFLSCKGLTSITFGENSQLTSIGMYAFARCSGLTSIEIPSSVASIESLAFNSCSGLTSVSIPSSVTSIGKGAFSSCGKLESMTLPFVGATKDGTVSTCLGYIFGTSSYTGGVSTYQVRDTYYIPSSLKSVTILGGNILDYAFYNCSRIESISLKEGITTIVENAFYGCNLANIEIPNSVTSIETGFGFGKLVYNEFENGKYLGNSENKYVALVDVIDTTVTSFNINPNTKIICSSSFYDCKKLESINIPSGVVYIGYGAFRKCEALLNVDILNGVKTIDDQVFFDCISLKRVGIPASVTNIGERVFENCSRLENIYISDIAAWCNINFKDKKVLNNRNIYLNGKLVTELMLPNEVTNVNTYAFYGCKSLTKVGVSNSMTHIGTSAFENCSNLQEIHISDIVAWCNINLEDSTFLCNRSIYLNGECLTDLVLPEGVTNINSYSFRNCTEITNITIPTSVKVIGEGAFDGCTNLVGVYITDINQWCQIQFDNAYSNPLYYAGNLYLNGELITNLEIPNSVTSIGKYAFSKCTSIITVVIPNSVTNIGKSAFYQCENITEMTIPFVGNSYYTNFGYIFGTTNYHDHNASVPHTLRTVVITGDNSIDSYAFYDCRYIRNIIISNDTKYIGRSAFEECYNLETLTIGYGVVSIGNNLLDSSVHYGNKHSVNIHCYKNTTAYDYAIENNYKYTLIRDENTQTPIEPILQSKTETTVTLTPVDGYEYKMGNGSWQSSNVFYGLAINTSYTFYQRIAQSDRVKASVSSAGVEITTNDHIFSAERAETAYLFSTADCTHKAVYYHSCVECGLHGLTTFEYGNFDTSKHDFSSTLIQGESTHFYKCTRCDAITGENDHDYVSYSSNNDNTHTGTCVCGKTAVLSCSGGTATCTDTAVCSVCNTAYGSIDTNNHDYSATLTQSATTHYYECSRCYEKNGEAPHTYNNYSSNNNDTHSATCTCGRVDTKACSGGTATCIDTAVCSVCNTAYGSIDTNNHDYSATLTQSATTHYYECSRCYEKNGEAPHTYNNYSSNNNDTHSATCTCGRVDTKACSGGTATCTDTAVCSVCNTAYGIVDVNNHAYSSTLTQGNMTHYYECSRCHGKNSEEYHEYKNYTSNNNTHTGTCVCGKTDTKTCSGGTANCTDEAICSVCNTAYGSIDTSNHNYASTLTQGATTHYYECSRCHGKKNEAEHEYKNYTFNGNDTHTGTCICGKTDTKACSGNDASATCQTKATCTICGSGYGSFGSHDYDMTAWGYKGTDGHAHMCKTSGCTAHDTAVQHTSSGTPTEYDPETCTICGFVINPATRHIHHTPVSEWSSNSTHHWKECVGCSDQELQKGTHVYDNACDTTCNTCEYVRQITHNYTYKHNDTQHWQECSVCGSEKPNSRDNHSGGNATCADKSVCTYCSVAYGEKNANNHLKSTYHYITNSNGTHKKIYDCCNATANASEACSGGTANCTDKAICSVCNTAYGSIDISNHNYASTLTQGATTHYYECSRCHGKKNEAEHEYKNYTFNGNDTHTGTCICGKTDTKACSGNDASATCQTKATCTICGSGYGSFGSHDYDMTVWGYKGTDGHAHMCKTSGCTTHDTAVQHTSSGTPTEANAEICTVCQYVINPALAHTTHIPKAEWSSDATHHWHECTGCSGQQLEKVEHVYDNACDTTCNTCSYVRQITHNYIDLKHNDTEHWHECTCGEKSDKAEHAYGDGNVCDACGYEKSDQSGTESPGETEKPTDTDQPTDKPTDTDKQSDDEEKGGCGAVVGSSAAIMMAVICCASLIFIKKRKEN